MAATQRNTVPSDINPQMPAGMPKEQTRRPSRSSSLTIPTNSVVEGKLEPIKSQSALLGGKSAHAASAHDVQVLVTSVFTTVEKAHATLGFQKMMALLDIFQSNDQQTVKDALSLKRFADIKDKGQNPDYVRMGKARALFEGWMLFGTAEMEKGMQNLSFENILKAVNEKRREFKAIADQRKAEFDALNDVRANLKIPAIAELTPELINQAKQLAAQRADTAKAEAAKQLEAAKTPQARAHAMAKSMLTVAKKENLSDDFLMSMIGQLKSALKAEIKARDAAAEPKAE